MSGAQARLQRDSRPHTRAVPNMEVHLSSLRKGSRYCFVAKQQVAIGEDMTSASSHSPRDWMWHGSSQWPGFRRRNNASKTVRR